jgi:hypothetical protein
MTARELRDTLALELGLGYISEDQHGPDVDWNAGGCVHNWRNYIPECVQDMWADLPEEARVIAWAMAEDIAGREEWE